MILFILSVVAGVLTTLAPCTLPLLPVIVGSSVSGVPSRKKALIITASLGASIIIFTFLLKVSTIFIHIPQEVWPIISGVIISTFGLISLFPEVWERLPLTSKINREGNALLSTGYQKENLWGNILIGLSLGPVFSSCSPTYFVILATVLPISLFLGFVDLLGYALGLSFTLYLVAVVGQRIVSKLGGISDTHGWFRRTLGAVFLLLGIAIIFGIDRKVETNILDSGVFDITKVEQILLKFNSKPSGINAENYQDQITTVSPSGIPTSHGPKAPEFVNPSGFINTDGKPITLAQFKGKKVVLLDVWTYSCINCQRTLPFVESWYEKYKDMGLVVVGLHTPEFAFEKVKSNVEEATKWLGVTYPVVMDNDYGTWNAYGNQYWPRKYLISENGEIIYDHVGEGNYDETEKEIQKALSELNGKIISGATTDIIPVTIEAGSPETYFGSKRNEYLGSGRAGVSGEQYFSEPENLLQNTLYLIGQWNIAPEYAETSKTVGSPQVGSDRIDYVYKARSVYFVAGASAPIDVEVLRDSKPVEKSFAGQDIFYKDERSYVKIQQNRLYKIIEDSNAGKHFLELIIPSGGWQAFTFTFG